ncbi:ROK family protein [Salipaludibacillus agaradhaerens]|uniref:ROK family protein n=1 Tax=Salipaludibacillus agaradhaerens TaxID=76935 RepID=UPI0021512520|nr:ROK family protein [Salipaludibacillus agaradhaerens]MCR6117771.1 ROK family protein [Salipaludibacillus agaradhaerens]UJW56939.1 ROK family protein [Bacillus sp. A116_S68]
MLGGIEAGGTKFVCAVANDDLTIVERVAFPTRSPEETFNDVFEFFDKFELKALGIGSFGPIDVNEQSPSYGFITDTPKPFWSHFDFVGTLKEKYDVPVFWTTDVNAAAYGEKMKGSAVNNESCLYLTVGTGVGGGVIYGENILEGFSHPEMGHILVQPHAEDPFEGGCPFHKNCLEGLASGSAIEKRFGRKGDTIPQDDKFWKIEAYYMAQALMTYTLTLRPEKIILGGGVMMQDHLLISLREEFSRLLNGYVTTPDLSEYIVTPALKGDAGIVGSLLLAEKALQEA